MTKPFAAGVGCAGKLHPLFVYSLCNMICNYLSVDIGTRGSSFPFPVLKYVLCKKFLNTGASGRIPSCLVFKIQNQGNSIFDDMRKDLQTMKIKNWKRSVLDRDLWKKIVERTKTHTGL